MKKNNKKASILLWAVMLSLIIAITFISISSKINKSIKLSWNMNSFNEEKNKINISLYHWINENLNWNKSIIFENNKERILWLKTNEVKQFNFSGASDFNIDIWIIHWWALKYKYLNNNTITSSGIINYSTSFTWELNNNTWSLILNNLWWYTKFLIKSQNSFEENEKKYKIVTKIWNNFFNETKNDK